MYRIKKIKKSVRYGISIVTEFQLLRNFNCYGISIVTEFHQFFFFRWGEFGTVDTIILRMKPDFFLFSDDYKYFFLQVI